MRRTVFSMAPRRRVLWLLFLIFGVGCSVWSVWHLFTDTNRVVSGLIAAVVAVAVARPVATNLLWAISLLFWKPHKWMIALYEWLQSPQITEDADTSMPPPGSSARELLEHVVQVGTPADREAAAKALKLLPADGQPPNVQQARDAQAALIGSPVVKAWKALDDLATNP